LKREYVGEEVPRAVERATGARVDKYFILRSKYRKEFLVDLKGGQCEVCGYRKSMRALDFHHRERAAKKFNIGIACREVEDFVFHSLVVPEVEEECILLCSNCHRELHERETQEKLERRNEHG
jgi:hypothetical protein